MVIEIALVILAAVVGFVISHLFLHATCTPTMKFACNIGASVIAAAVGVGILYAGMYAPTADVQVLNGKVASKEQDRVSCSHSYQCNCVTSCSTSSTGSTSCSTTCSTCYEHSHDFDWNVHTTVGSITIDRIDRQGVHMPSRWEQVAIGEPAAQTETFVNYVKGASDSIFHKQAFSEKYKAPPYPNRVYDYYRIDRVVEVGTRIADKKKLNTTLNMALRELGGTKQVNIVPVFVRASPDYARFIEQSWMGGKKNDVVIVTGLGPDSRTIEWVYVFSWSSASIVNVSLRNALTELGTYDVDTYVPTVVTQVQKHYKRKPMAEYEYLKAELSPSTEVTVLAIIVSIVLQCLTFFGFMSAQSRVRPGRFFH